MILWEVDVILKKFVPEVKKASITIFILAVTMFISVFIPESRKNRIVCLLVALSFAASLACDLLPVISDLSEGIRIILLTVTISLLAAILFPIREDGEKKEEKAQ